MKKLVRLSPALFFSFWFLLAGCTSKKQPRCFCSDPERAGSPCPVIPHEVNERALFIIDYDPRLDSAQQAPFDLFSWQSFVALNWPADASGQPMKGSIGGHPGLPRVWEYYTDPNAIFHASNGMELCFSGNNSGTAKLLYRMSKSPGHSINPEMGFDEADGNALIDRNLNFALFEVRLNPDEVNYIRRNNLQTKAGIKAYSDSLKRAGLSGNINLPAGFYVPDTGQTGGTVGAIEVKVTWKILLPGIDDTSRFYHRKAAIYVPAENTQSGKPMCINAIVGLAGMHIIHKTGKLPDMVWSTFEHIDNVPSSTNEAQMNPGRKYSFYNQKCLNCPPNTFPKPFPEDSGHLKWADTLPYAVKYRTSVLGETGTDSAGTQVTRTYPIYFETQLMNKLWQEKLKGTVWANYQLIGSQWRKKQIDPPFAQVDIPHLLANSVLETYIQKNSSCITCHNDFAKVIVAPGDTVKGDLSFMFGHAR